MRRFEVDEMDGVELGGGVCMGTRLFGPRMSRAVIRKPGSVKF